LCSRPKGFPMKYLALIALYSFNSFAEVNVVLNEGDYSFNHPTCLIRFDSKLEFADKLEKKLKEKGFKTDAYLPEGKLNPEDMYFHFTLNRVGLIYKECQLEFKIQEAKSVKPVSSDPVFFSAKTTRSLPRVTFSGDERCTRGIDDLFVELPNC